MEYLAKALRIERRFCTIANHESILSERAIRSLSDILITKLEGNGRLWPIFIQCTCFAYNTSPHTLLGGYSPFELLFARKPKDPLNLDTSILVTNMPITVQEYVTTLKARLNEVGQTATDLHNQSQQSQAIDRARTINRKPIYQIGDLVYLFFPRASPLITGTIKFRTSYIGPLVISARIDDRLVTLADLRGKPIYGLHSIKKLKRAYFKVNHKSATNSSDIREAVNQLDEARKLHKNIPIQPQQMFCLQDGITPTLLDINQCLTPVDPDHALSNECTIDLAPYCMASQNDTTKAIGRPQSEQEERQEERIGKGLPQFNEELTIKRARYKQGNLQILLSKEKKNDYNIWFSLDSRSYKPINGLILKPVVDIHSAITGRMVVRTKAQSGDQIVTGTENSNDDSFRVIGSRETEAKKQFVRPAYKKHNQQAPRKRQNVKKVCFNNKIDIITNQLAEIDLD